MAEHGTVEYATATGNDYPSHEGTYERFVHLTFASIIYVITILLGLAAGGVAGHWLMAAAIFVIGLLGLVPALVSNSRAMSYASFVICLLIFAYAALS
jgi:uncharacterized membrane protein